MPRLQSIRSFASLSFVALGGLMVRCLGMRLGLPYRHHWDECWVIWSAEAMLAQHNDLPTSYQYGAPMSRWIVLCVMLGRWCKVLPEGVLDEITLVWIGRFLSIVLSATGILAMYLAGYHALGNKNEKHERHFLGLSAALLYAFGYELVVHARYAVTDAVVVSCVAWSLACCALYLHHRKLFWGLTGMFCAGLAFAFKPTALPTVLIPLLTLLCWPPSFEAGEGQWPRFIYRALLVAMIPFHFACFFFFNPHYLDHWFHALRDLTQRMAQTREGGFPKFLLRTPGIEHLSTALWALIAHTLSRIAAIAVPLSGIACLGAAMAVRFRIRVVWVALLHASATVVAIAWPNKAFLLRNNLIAVPAMCLSFAIGLWWITQTLSRAHKGNRVASLLALVCPWIVLAPVGCATMWDSIRNQALSVDARLRALDWLNTHVDHPVEVAVTPSVRGRTSFGEDPGAQALQRARVHVVREVEDCAAVADSAPEYVLTASFMPSEEEKMSPYQPMWHLYNCPGYTPVADFEANPFEHTYWVTETWGGRVDARLLHRDTTP